MEFSAADFAHLQGGGGERQLHGDAPGRLRPATVDTSAKLGRLAELVDEAADNGRKVVIFSYFRDVLDTVQAILAAAIYGSRCSAR